MTITLSVIQFGYTEESFGLRAFKKMAKQVLALTDEQLQRLIDNGQFEEVVKDD